METAINQTENPFFSSKKNKSEAKGKIFIGITQIAVILIIAILFVILGIIIYQGRSIFTQDGGFGFWTVFSILSIVGFVVLWKPIMWIVGVFQLLGGAGE